MTGQLPLALELREGHALENFHAGPNRAAWATVSAAGDGDERQVFVWSAAGQGRSHLLEGAVRRAQEQGRDACLLPAAELLPLVPDVLESMEQFQLPAVDDVDLFEINEAFAMVAMMPMLDLGIPHEKLNIHGGACALGHPIGSTGSRIILTLIHALKRTGGKRGVASLCIGGGEATAVAIELV